MKTSEFTTALQNCSTIEQISKLRCNLASKFVQPCIDKAYQLQRNAGMQIASIKGEHTPYRSNYYGVMTYPDKPRTYGEKAGKSFIVWVAKVYRTGGRFSHTICDLILIEEVNS